MESEQYFSCPICAKITLKSKGQMLIWTMICKECYQKMLDAEKKVKENNHDKERTA